MVAAGDHVGAGLEELAADLVGDAEAGSGVLPVDDHEVEVEALAQAGQMGGHGVASRPADDVAAEQQSHRLWSSFLYTCPACRSGTTVPPSVTTRSRG
jgi:hypothetical protein